MKYTYQPKGVCSKQFNFEIEDNKIVSFQAINGCNGNLQGVGALMKGRSVEEVISILKGIQCGLRPTSCPDQIAQALMAYQKQNG